MQRHRDGQNGAYRRWERGAALDAGAHTSRLPSAVGGHKSEWWEPQLRGGSGDGSSCPRTPAEGEPMHAPGYALRGGRRHGPVWRVRWVGGGKGTRSHGPLSCERRGPPDGQPKNGSRPATEQPWGAHHTATRDGTPVWLPL